MLCQFVKVHLVLLGPNRHPSSVAKGCYPASTTHQLWLGLLVLLLQTVVKLLKSFESLVHVYVLGCGTMRLVEAAEILLCIAEMLHMVWRRLVLPS